MKTNVSSWSIEPLIQLYEKTLNSQKPFRRFFVMIICLALFLVVIDLCVATYDRIFSRITWGTAVLNVTLSLFWLLSSRFHRIKVYEMVLADAQERIDILEDLQASYKPLLEVEETKFPEGSFYQHIESSIDLVKNERYNFQSDYKKTTYSWL